MRVGPRGFEDVCLDRLHTLPLSPVSPRAAGGAGDGSKGGNLIDGSIAVAALDIPYGGDSVSFKIYILLFLSPRWNWAWGIDPPGGAGVKLTGSEKLGSRWRVTRTGAGWAPARVLLDEEQVTVPDGGCGGGRAGGGGSVCGGGLGRRRAWCRA